jgi:hypothetical protein
LPRDHQRVPLRARGAEPGTRFAFADGSTAGCDAAGVVESVPRTPSGALVDGSGQELDHATFEVR